MPPNSSSPGPHPAHTPHAHAEAAREEGEVAGAVNMLQAMAIFRTFSRQPLALATLAAALMASGARAGPKTGASITQLFSVLAVRLIRPPALVAAQVRCSMQWGPLGVSVVGGWPRGPSDAC